MKSCPIPIAYSASGTGRATTLHCALNLLGADEMRYFYQLSPAKALQLCTVSIPLGLDDPDTKFNFCSLDLFNGAKKGTVKSILCQALLCHPTSLCMKNKGMYMYVRTSMNVLCRCSVTCADDSYSVHIRPGYVLQLCCLLSALQIMFFTVTCRYASRCLLIEFKTHLLW